MKYLFLALGITLWVNAAFTQIIYPPTSGSSGGGEIIISPAQLTAEAANWNPSGLSTATVIRLSALGTFQIISGIMAPTAPKELTLTNVGSIIPVLITREDAASLAVNRFSIPFDLALYPNCSFSFYYDNTTNRWRLKNSSEMDYTVLGKQFKDTFFTSGSVTSADYDTWLFTTASGAITTVAPTATAPRLTQLSTSTSATAGPYVTGKAAHLYLGRTTTSPNSVYCKVVFTIQTLSTATETFTTIAGLPANTTAFTAQPDGAYWKYTNSLNSGNFTAVTRTGGTETTTDSGVAAAANILYTFEVLHRPDNSVAFFLNGNYVAEHTTNIHDGYAYALADIIKSVGTSVRTIQLHAIHYIESRI